MEQRELTQEESLNIISSMIEKAKGQIGRDSIHYLVWGWLGFVAAIGQFALRMLDFPHHYITWIILMPIGGIWAFFQGRKQQKRTMGYSEKAMAAIWGAFTFSLLIVLANGFIIQWQVAYAFMLVLVGLATYVSGAILDFTPLKIGGYLSWALFALAIYTNLDYAILAIAISMFGSYLIPGYLLKARYGKEA